MTSVCGRTSCVSLEAMKPAREGRELQRFDGDCRLVTGCVPIYHGKLVLISSQNFGWVFPKGGWESDETQQQGAAREAYEEAGVVGVISEKPIGSYNYSGKAGNHGRAVFYILEVTELLDRWPESPTRKRKLVTVEQAKGCLTRPEQKALLPLVQEYLSRTERQRIAHIAMQCVAVIGAVALSAVIVQHRCRR